MDDLDAALRALSKRFQHRCESDRIELISLSRAEPAGLGRMRDIAHALAGAGGTLGFPDVTLRARELEQAIDDEAPISTRFVALLEELSKCRAADLPNFEPSLEEI